MDYHHGEVDPRTAEGNRYNVGLVTSFYHDISSLPFYLLTFLCLILINWIAGSGLLIHGEENQSWS